MRGAVLGGGVAAVLALAGWWLAGAPSGPARAETQDSGGSACALPATSGTEPLTIENRVPADAREAALPAQIRTATFAMG
ncbi:MAG: hypothetical protein HS116_12815 [Planctomycetes bacterium]|nr:hypothetical protein [Planctomycetota bacterium]